MTRNKRTTAKRKRRPFIKPKVVIFGEGETEKEYIEKLKELDCFSYVAFEFRLKEDGNFETYFKENLDNDYIFAIIDIDGMNKNHHRYQKNIKLLKSYEKHVFFSNHSFETWLLNHIIFFSKPITKQQEYNPYMNKHFGVKSWSKYKDANNRKIVMSKVDCKSIIKAKENVKKLDWNKPFDNPSCNMDKFIEKLLELNEKEKSRNND